MLLHRGGARNRSETWPRMAASEEWKIGRVRMIALVEEVLDKEKIAVAQDRLKRGHLRVGAQDENPVEARASSASLPASISNSGRLWPRLCADSADDGIADQRLVALLQLRIERGDDRFTVLAVVLGFRFVAADDIAKRLQPSPA